MDVVTGGVLNPTQNYAIHKIHLSSDRDREAYAEELLNGKNEIDKQDVLDHLDDFSCQEELERYVENKEES